MKIEYIKLVNFSNIYTAMNTTEIEIDFKKCKNKIILLEGPNGSGKTSILSCLHPFATNGNLDTRADNSLIRTGKDGYKEIHLNDEGNEYIIKHYYNVSKETHSVKSYIIRNGMELNPNGNVTSFKETIKNELDIEIDYLKLTRLGDNVTNFIDLKTTDRKSFMGKILNEVDIYLKYYKKITNDMRQLKSVISHIIDKISKLGISDENEVKKIQKHLNKEITRYKSDIDNINGEISIINYEINKYDSLLVVKENLDIKKHELNKIYKVLNKKDYTDISIDECSTEILNITNEINTYMNEYNVLIEKRNSTLSNLDKLLEELNEVSSEISKIKDSSDIRDTQYMIDKLRTDIEKRSKENNIIDFHPNYTKKELEDLIIMLDTCMDILYTTYEFGKGPIKKAIEYISSKDNINEYVESNNSKINKNKLQAMSEYVFNEVTKRIGSVNINCKDSHNCKVVEFYNEIYDLATEVPDAVIEDETFITYTKLAYQNINTVISNIQSFKELFGRLPNNIKNMFLVQKMFDNIESLGCIYDKTIMYHELSLITEYELQEENLNKLSELKSKLSLLKKSIGNVEYFENKKEELINDIDNKKEEISSYYEKISKLSKDISDRKEDLRNIEELKECIDKKDTIEFEYNELDKIYNLLKSLMNDKKSKEVILDDLTYKYNKYVKEYSDNDYKLKSYESLSSELNSYNETYEEMTLVKQALSSKEGIPLLYIEIYLKSIQEITNDLLNIIYNDELYIEKFNISADEFKIPYVKKGTSIHDVCSASQGEKSFISLALSFALTYQSISRYNIMLLDEIDSTLDTSNREKFLQILEKQIDMIDSEQIFVISHNNMFNAYPIDVINTKNKINSDNKLSNYIKINIK